MQRAFLLKVINVVPLRQWGNEASVYTTRGLGIPLIYGAQRELQLCHEQQGVFETRAAFLHSDAQSPPPPRAGWESKGRRLICLTHHGALSSKNCLGAVGSLPDMVALKCYATALTSGCVFLFLSMSQTQGFILQQKLVVLHNFLYLWLELEWGYVSWNEYMFLLTCVVQHA